MAAWGPMEDIQHFKPGRGHLQAGIFEIIGAGHGPYHNGEPPQIDMNFLMTQTAFRSGFVFAALAAICASLIAAGCSTPKWVENAKDNPPNWLTPYRVDIGQGNYVTESMAAQLKEGMTKEQVRAVLGTPLLVDPFRTDRWDYVFDIKRGDGKREQRRFTLNFKDDRLTSWGGDPLPKEGGEGVLPSRPAR